MDQVVNLEEYSLASGYSYLLSKINLAVHRGESLAVVGSAGSGKSVLLAVLGQALQEFVELDLPVRQSGTASVLGQRIAPGPLTKTSLKLIYSQVSFIAERSSWMPMSIAKNFELVRQMWGLGAPVTFEEMLELFPLTSRNKATLLSLAELLPQQIEPPLLQQMAILRALLRKPALLLLDEPFARMDPVLLRQTESLILDMTEQSTTIWATNDLHQASRTSDKVLFMQQGNAIECSTTKTFFTNPQSREAENFIAGREE